MQAVQEVELVYPHGHAVFVGIVFRLSTAVHRAAPQFIDDLLCSYASLFCKQIQLSDMLSRPPWRYSTLVCSSLLRIDLHNSLYRGYFI